MMMEIRELEQDVAKEVMERQAEIVDDEDVLTEIADSHIPIYYSDLAECLANDTSLSEPEDTGLVAEECKDIWKILSISIYERLSQAAHQAWEEIQED